MGFFTKKELNKIGFKSLGENILISDKCSIYSPEKISIGNNVRIDDFSILSGNILLGNNIHISAGVYMFAGNVGIEIGDFSGISSKTVVYAISDDFDGSFLIGPMVDIKYRKIFSKKVYIGRHVQIGTSCTILPGVRLEEGISVGAMSLVNKNLENWSINIGVPAIKLKERKKDLLKLEKEFLREKGGLNGK